MIENVQRKQFVRYFFEEKQYKEVKHFKIVDPG